MSPSARGRPPNHEPMRTWFAPVVVAVLSVVGLFSALLGNGPHDAVAWLALGTPVGTVAWALLARRR